MSKQSLSKAVKAYFDKQSLSEHQLDSYEAMFDNSEPKISAWTSYTKFIAAAASILLVMILSFQYYSVEQDIDMGMEIAQEVAKNHIKMKPLEVKSNQLGDLKRYFDQLDFSLIESERLLDKTMLGARYCSIQGVTAAQLRYQQSDKSLSGITVYEVDYQPELFGKIPDIDKGMEPRKIVLKGLELHLWVEKGLLFASAQELPLNYLIEDGNAIKDRDEQ